MHANGVDRFHRRGKEKDSERLSSKKEDREQKPILEPTSQGQDKGQSGRGDGAEVSSKPDQSRRADASPKLEPARRSADASSKPEKIRRTADASSKSEKARRGADSDTILLSGFGGI